jgi:hypothetical protein
MPSRRAVASFSQGKGACWPIGFPLRADAERVGSKRVMEVARKNLQRGPQASAVHVEEAVGENIAVTSPPIQRSGRPFGPGMGDGLCWIVLLSLCGSSCWDAGRGRPTSLGGQVLAGPRSGGAYGIAEPALRSNSLRAHCPLGAPVTAHSHCAFNPSSSDVRGSQPRSERIRLVSALVRRWSPGTAACSRSSSE